MQTKLVNIKELKLGEIRQEVLPDGFIKRVLDFKEILKEVETSSLEETVSNFQRDFTPENELLIWESIASCFKLSCENNPNWTCKERKKAFAKLLASTLS